MIKEITDIPDSIQYKLIQNDQYILIMETNGLSMAFKLMVKVSQDKTDMYYAQLQSLEKNDQLWNKFETVKYLAQYLKESKLVQVNFKSFSIQVYGTISRRQRDNQREIQKKFCIGEIFLVKVSQRELKNKCLEDYLRKLQTGDQITDRQMRKYLKTLIKCELSREKQIFDIKNSIQHIKDNQSRLQKQISELNKKVETIRIGTLQKNQELPQKKVEKGQNLLQIKENPDKWNIRLWIDTEATNMNLIAFDDDVIVAKRMVQIFLKNKVQKYFELTFQFNAINGVVSLGVIDSLEKRKEISQRNNFITYGSNCKLQNGNIFQDNIGYGFKRNDSVRICVDTFKGLIHWVVGQKARKTATNLRLTDSKINWVPYLKLQSNDAVLIKDSD